MNKLTSLLFLALPMILAACSGSSNSIEENTILTSNIRGVRQVDLTVYSGGQPTQDQLAQLSAAGIKNIISLRHESEIDWDEEKVVTDLGMTFHNIPVRGTAGLTTANSELLQKTLAEIGDEPVLVHCGSGNRVGALVALNEVFQNKLSIEDAIVEGKR